MSGTSAKTVKIVKETKFQCHQCPAMAETGGEADIDPKKYFGVKFLPIDIWDWEGCELKPFLSRFCPPPLHLLLGSV